jgi:hypothetical protein
MSWLSVFATLRTRQQKAATGHKIWHVRWVNPYIGTGVVDLSDASAVLRHQLLYIREGEIQRPNPDFVVPFHGLISFLFVARDNIQKETASNRLVGYIVPPALIFRPPAHLTAHGSYLLAPGTQKAAREDAPAFVQTEIGLPACLPGGSPLCGFHDAPLRR